MPGSALVVGASGIVGNNLARHLRDRGWQVYGLARRPPDDIDGVSPLAADLLDAQSLRTALAGLRPTHVFISAWLRQKTEADNIRVNSAMVRNVLGALSPARSVRHVALVTGLKHYLGPFEAYGKGKLPPTPFREEQPRLAVDNFYYAQEDELFAAAARDGFGWSVHRPHTIIGYAVGNAMNMGVTLAVYATICRETARPFLFPGSAVQWNGLTDMTDARLLARHLEWASTTAAARNQAFNVVNGDVFRWNWMWGRIAGWFGLEPAPFPGEGVPLERQLADAAPVWADIAHRHGLAEPDLASSPHPGTPTPIWGGRSRSSPT
jgi:nucleoside-diphosphate-sugar epimerase